MRKIPIVILLVLPLIVASAQPPSANIVFYAEKVSYPLPSIPEPVLQGGVLKVISSLEIDGARIYNEFGSYDLSFLSKNSSGYFFLIPKVARPGLYNLVISSKSETIEEPHSVWVMSNWPKMLKLLAFGDVKTPTAAPNFFEAVKEINLINPDVAIFLGDLVETPSISSAWKLFLGSYNLLEVPTYVVIGNHEYEATGKADIYRSIFGPWNYSVSIGNFIIVVLPTDEDGWIREEYIKWADGVLSAADGKFKILAFHHPLFSPGLKDRGIYEVNVSSLDDFDRLLSNNYIYGSFADHPKEAKMLFSMIINRDVRLILSEHIHTDLNVMVRDWNGKIHYFISPAAIAYDIRQKDIRGFKLLRIYENGTVDLRSTYYDGTGFANYPNSIPLDSGEGVEPYKLGFLKYFYVNNDGKHHDVSFEAINELKEEFCGIRVVFRLPQDVPMSSYRVLMEGTRGSYETIDYNGIRFVIFRDVCLPANSTVSIGLYTSEDKTPPIIKFLGTEDYKNWIIARFSVQDSGWGPKNMSISYRTGKKWEKPDLVDISPMENGTIVYSAWIPAKGAEIRAVAYDFAGNSATWEQEGAQPAQAQPAEQPQVLYIAVVIALLAVTILLVAVIRRRR
ncbi:MAG: metallophosphoesterase family protein [Candidatus Methanodesulfokora sp.]